MDPRETKRRFFRKAGSSSSASSSRTQASLDSLSPSQSPVPSHSPSLENTSVAGLGAMLAGRARAGNSMSLDEASEVKMSRSPRFSAAPRRARSAERFDGMRINCSGSPAEAFLYAQTREDLLSRNLGRSGRESANAAETLRRNQATMAHAVALAAGLPSPPPTYNAAVTELTGPPSYHQAVAAMTSYQQSRAGRGGGGRPNARYAALAQAHRGAQSFDTDFGSYRNPMRSAVSVPAFTDDVICSCSKCHVLNSKQEGEYHDSNDAVYMESQAFLMHEIMTDGMAFCSIM